MSALMEDLDDVLYRLYKSGNPELVEVITKYFEIME